MEDIIWLKFEHKLSGHNLTLCIGSSRRCDGEAFYRDMMLKFYEYQNEEDVIICGDLNSRCADESDFKEDVDDVPPRKVIDGKLNSY